MRSGIKNLSAMVKYVFITTWLPANKLEWYSVIIWSAHISGIANSAYSFSGLVLNLNNSESSNMYLSANTFNFTYCTLRTW